MRSKWTLGGLAALTVTAAALGLAAGPASKPDTPPPAAPPAATPQDDLAAMQGIWQAGEAQVDLPKDERCYVHGRTLWLISPDADGGSASRYELSLTADRNPKWLDLTPSSNQGAVPQPKPEETVRCIYRLTDNTLEFVISMPSVKFRPAEFVDVPNLVVTYKFRRPKEAPAQKPADGRESLLGRWVVSKQSSPDQFTDVMLDRTVGVVEFTPDYVFVQRPDKEDPKLSHWEAAEYALDTSKNPKWIDLTFGTAAADGAFGVYELAGDALRLSYRRGVPRVFRTLEFQAGLEGTAPDVGKEEGPKVACSLFELTRARGSLAHAPSRRAGSVTVVATTRFWRAARVSGPWLRLGRRECARGCERFHAPAARRELDKLFTSSRQSDR